MKRALWWLFVFTLFLNVSSQYGSVWDKMCQPMNVQSCQGILKYNSTTLHHPRGDVAPVDPNTVDLQLRSFRPLINTKCSALLEFFLCASYVPMCDETHRQVIRPCRSMCEHVRGECEHILRKYDHDWFPDLNCDNYKHMNTEDSMCIEKNEMTAATTTTPTTTTVMTSPSVTSPSPCSLLRHGDRYVYVNRTGRCASRCGQNVLYTQDQRRFMQTWQILWALIALCCAVVMTIACALKPRAVSQTDRSLLFISVCVGMQALGYVVRMGAGAKRVSCGQEAGEEVLLHEGVENTACAIVFLLLYYFGTAAVTWWLVLVLEYVIIVTKRIRVRQERYTSYTHLAAWALPATQTIVILVMRSVDGDELSGTCYVGNQSRRDLLAFVIAPLAVYLCIGVVMLLYGVIHAHRTRHRPQMWADRGTVELATRTNLQPDKYRTGLLAALLLFAYSCLLACHVYEYISRPSWLRINGAKPVVEVIYVRVLISLLIGILSTVAAHKTLSRAWSQISNRLCIRPLKVKYSAPPSSTSSAQTSSRSTRCSYSGHYASLSLPLVQTPRREQTLL